MGTGSWFLIRDNDDKYGHELDTVAKAAGTKVLRTPTAAPRPKEYCRYVFYGLDVHRKFIQACEVDEGGRKRREFRIHATPEAITCFAEGFALTTRWFWRQRFTRGRHGHS